MRALVTGGLGYIGHAVTVDLRKHGHEVTVLSQAGAPTRPDVEVVLADLRDRARIGQIVRDGGFDAIEHLGGMARVQQSFEEPLAYFDVNVGGTTNLLHAIDELDAERQPSLVYASTTLVYGSRLVGAVSEMTEPAPESPYADTKVAAERLISAQAVSGRLRATILRIFNVAGGVEGITDTDTSRIIPNLLRVAADPNAEITLVGNGLGMRDFVHVADVARAIRLSTGVATPGHCDVFNIGSGGGTRIIDLVEEVEAVTGRTLRIKHAREDGAPPKIIADISHAESRLGWVPEVSDPRTIITDAWACWPH